MAETTETPVLDLLARMIADSIEAADLDSETFDAGADRCARRGVDRNEPSYLMNLGVA